MFKWEIMINKILKMYLTPHRHMVQTQTDEQRATALQKYTLSQITWISLLPKTSSLINKVTQAMMTRAQTLTG